MPQRCFCKKLKNKNTTWEKCAYGTTLFILYSEMNIANTALNLKGENQSGWKQVGGRGRSFSFNFIFTYLWTFYPLSSVTAPFALSAMNGVKGVVVCLYWLVKFQVKLIGNLSLRSSDNGSVNWHLHVESSESQRCQTFNSKRKARRKESKALKTGKSYKIQAVRRIHLKRFKCRGRHYGRACASILLFTSQSVICVLCRCKEFVKHLLKIVETLGIYQELVIDLS